MLGGHLSVAVLLLFLTQTGTPCSCEDDFSSVTLPAENTLSEYITRCSYEKEVNPGCAWTTIRDPGDATLDVLETAPLGVQGQVCLEFWYLPPATGNGSELHVWLKTSAGLADVWASPVLPRDSWRRVSVPLAVTEPTTQVVFEAMGANSTQEQIEFKHISVRKGSCGPQCEADTDFWTDPSTRCLCSAAQLSCSPSRCAEGQICGPDGGHSNRVSSTGMCTIHRHTDCSTFDGVLFRFMAPCTYVLARTCSPAEAMPQFSVEVVNEQAGNASLPTVQRVILEMGDVRIMIVKRQTKRVVVNGVWRKLPLKLTHGAIKIKSNPAAIVLQTGFGLSVSYDSAGAIQVTLPPSYSDQVCGLCGNFNQLQDDDFLKPDGTHAKNATALAASWQTGETTSPCETIFVPHQCDPLEEAEYASEKHCGGLLSSSGPFAGCLSVLGAESYFRACLVSMCSSHGDPAVLCETLQAYAEVCQQAGVAVSTWRNSTSCSLRCGANSHFNSCAEGCPEVCSQHDLSDSCGSCEERCECDSGFQLSGGKCVPAEDCGCWYDGKHYEKGETLVTGDCEQHCQCMGRNTTRCTFTQCKDNEICKVKDGVKGCFPFSPATCSVYGDPHYVTFDQRAFDFQGGCSYTLTTTCGEKSAVQFRVIAHNMHPSLQNLTRSKLEAVTLEIGDLYLTLNQSGKVYAQGTQLPLPISAHGAYGSVKVYAKSSYVVLESTFGLRMMIDGNSRLFLQVDERHKYELCGMCGTYSDHQDDDFVTPGGQNVNDPFEFGESWRISDVEECVVHPSDPAICDTATNNEAYKECAAIFGEAFQACHEHAHPSIYLNSCVYDYCATNGDQHTLCESQRSYAAVCQVAGVELPNWEIGTACAEPTTTATTPTSSSPTPDQTLCPMNCNFDQNLCGWEQLVQDSFDWTRHSGPTPSELTGPNQDHTSGAGSYMYLEANNVIHGDSARLMSSTCHYSVPLCLNFWYHMSGSATAMALNIYLLRENSATKVWSKMDSQGPEWRPANIDISVSSPFQIIVEGIRGSNDQSDVAIDDIFINFGTCKESLPGLISGTEHPFTPSLLPSPRKCPLQCNFEQDLCGWSQLLTDVFDWTRHSGSTPTLLTGPSSDHSTGVGGHYLYIEANSATLGDTARLISSECFYTGPKCLQFWYHMHGSADTMGLNVYLYQNKRPYQMWWKRNDQGNMWHLAQVDLETTGEFQVILEGRRGSNEQSDIAIDDVSIHHGFCADMVKPTTTTQLPPSSTTPNRPTTVQPQPPTTTPPQPETTGIPHPPSTVQPESPTTVGPKPPTTSQPLPETTVRPQPPSTAQPESPTTVGPKPPTTSQLLPETTVRPQPPSTAQPESPTTVGPKPPTTSQPLPETTGEPLLTTTQTMPTTPEPKPSTTSQPQPETTARPNPTTTTAPTLPTTTQPQPPTTTTTEPQTTVGPKPTTTVQPESQTTKLTTARPHPTTTTKQPQTTTPLPSPSCPKNSHYTTCMSAWRPTCYDLDGSLHYHDKEPCVPGCVCNEGFVQGRKVCVPIHQCGCVDKKGKKYHFKEKWYTDHCRQKCECKKDDGRGKIECDDKDECDGNAVCLQDEEGNNYCHSTGFNVCSIDRDSEYRTFDRMKYTFEGEHSYVLVRTNNLPNIFQDVYIEGVNTLRDDDSGENSSEEERRYWEEDDHDHDHDHDHDYDHSSEEDKKHYRLQELKIRVYNHIIMFKRNRKLIVDGQRTDTPASPSGGLTIREHSSRIYLKTDFGLQVAFDGHSRAEITLPRIYRETIGGLCGNFDGRKWNDRMKPDGSMADSNDEFGESWAVTV